MPAGCEPTVDGTLHLEEWNDGVCFNVGDAGGPDMIIKMKYAGDSLYFASSGLPSCGCPMLFAFDPNGVAAANGDEFGIGVFDDPFQTNGDRVDDVLTAGVWNPGTVPTGIVTACPGNQPSLIRYEWKVPLAALGITPGVAHTFGFAISHPGGARWPASITTVSPLDYPTDPAEWGAISSTALWQ